MCFRLFGRTLLRRDFRSQILSHYLTVESQYVIKRLDIGVRSQQLHMKIYDKDARFQIQREANEHDIDEFFEDKAVLKIKEPMGVEKNVTSAFEAKDNILEEECDKEKSAEIFGNANLDEIMDPGDIEEEDFIRSKPPRKQQLTTEEYAGIIKQHLAVKDLKAALNVLEQRMLKEDCVKPDRYIYNVLIGGCAKAGYTRKAFKLFTKMRQRGINATGSTYTSLFNACANAPTSEEGLDYAKRLREVMIEKCYEPNVINYNAMIKAYGRCGDVQTAYMFADEMMEKKLEMNTETFNFLLQACASDREHGFRHCLLTWHKMLQRRVIPDKYTLNTVLRCVRDCGFGDLQSMEELLQSILGERYRIGLLDGQQELLPKQLKVSQTDEEVSTTANYSTEINDIDLKEVVTGTGRQLSAKNVADLEIVPNLLLERPHLGNLMSISEVKRPHERFLLVGGLTGFLSLMKYYKVTPGIESFTCMLEVIPPTRAAEKQLISFVNKIGLKSDLDFFNILIKKRSMRFDYDGAKEVLEMIDAVEMEPDIVTYGVLALGCCTREQARELLQEMRVKGIRMNIQILGAMLRQGCEQKAFSYVTEILQITLDEQIKPNDVFLTHLHRFYNQCARAIDARHPMTKKKSFILKHEKFCEKMRTWYEEQGISGLKLEDAIKKISTHPYKQYKEASVTGLEEEKNEKLARKMKLRKYIKKIKTKNLKGDED